MTFRAYYGLPEKATYRCPVCGVESKGRLGVAVKCKTHAQQGRPHNLRHRPLYKLVASAIDEARS